MCIRDSPRPPYWGEAPGAEAPLPRSYPITSHTTKCLASPLKLHRLISRFTPVSCTILLLSTCEGSFILSHLSWPYFILTKFAVKRPNLPWLRPNQNEVRGLLWPHWSQPQWNWVGSRHTLFRWDEVRWDKSNECSIAFSFYLWHLIRYYLKQMIKTAVYPPR